MVVVAAELPAPGVNVLPIRTCCAPYPGKTVCYSMPDEAAMVLSSMASTRIPPGVFSPGQNQDKQEYDGDQHEAGQDEYKRYFEVLTFQLYESKPYIRSS
jgi:hypothetical protein